MSWLSGSSSSTTCTPRSRACASSASSICRLAATFRSKIGLRLVFHLVTSRFFWLSERCVAAEYRCSSYVLHGGFPASRSAPCLRTQSVMYAQMPGRIVYWYFSRPHCEETNECTGPLLSSSSRPWACFAFSCLVGVNRPRLTPTISQAGVSGTLSTTARLSAKFWLIEPRS